MLKASILHIYCANVCKQGPPFGSFYEEYIELFSNLFTIEKLENSMQSAHPRKENEFWIKMRKK